MLFDWFLSNQKDRSECLITRLVEAFYPTLSTHPGLDPWRLAAVEQLTYSGKSLLLAFALSAGRLTLKEALEAVRLEEIFQSEEWGEVEAGN